MLTARPRSATPHPGDAGFTLLELMVVVGMMTIVLVIAGAALISLTKATNRGGTMITDEQNTSTVLARLAKDIRSAHTISFPTGAAPANETVLQVNNPGGGTTSVEWIYQQSAATLTREVQNSSGTYVPAGTPLTGLANSGTQPIFSYFSYKGTNESGSSTTLIVNCTSRVEIDLVVAPPPGTSAVANFEETADVAITDQLAILSAPGNGQC